MPLLRGPVVEGTVFTIHDRPADYPQGIVVTADSIRNRAGPGEPVRLAPRWTFRTVEGARAAIRATKPGAACFPRDPEDAPCVVESWF